METIPENESVFLTQNTLSDYFQKNNVVLYILTDCPRCECYTKYTISLMKTIELMKKMKIELHIEFSMNEKPYISKNNLIAKAISNPKMTHVIFIDSQVSWNPNDIIKLLLSEKDIIGGVCPTGYDMSILMENIKMKDLKKKYEKLNVSDELIIKSAISSYDMMLDDKQIHEQKINISNNICKIGSIGTQFVLIRRNAIIRMMEHYRSTKYMDTTGYLQKNEKEHLYALFDTKNDNTFCNEDVVFFKKWKSIGGSIYINVSIILQMKNTEEYNATFLLSLL